MEDIKRQIIDLFESKNANFKNQMKIEFIKSEPAIVTPEIYNYRNLKIAQLVQELKQIDNAIFDHIGNPEHFIEQTLFTHLLK